MNYNSYYNNAGIRETCKAVKQNENRRVQEKAMRVIAQYIISLNIVGEGDILIPVPQHTGSAEYTKQIANIVASNSGAVVADILKRVPKESLYEKKKNNKSVQPHLYLNQRIPPNNHYFFVDNVISTGTTFHTANKLFDYKLIPLVYAIDDTKPQAREIIREYK
jgi:predicted amidophosphoribosyltransferase